MENCIGPSNFHLKKELAVLSRSILLRDPETCPSWRSPLSSRSAAATTYCLNHAHENKKNIMSAYKSSGLSELEPISALPLRNGYRRRQTYLYNWEHHSSKSSDSGIKLDGDNREESVQDSAEDILTNYHEVMKNPASVLCSEGTKPKTPLRRKVRKVRTNTTPKMPVVRNLAKSMFLNLPSSSLEFLNSDDTEYCNSEELQCKMQELIQRSGHASHAGTPLLSASGSGNWLNSHKYLKNRGREELSCSFTPVSASSYNRYGDKNLSGVDSWDGTGGAFGGDHMYLPGSQVCGIPCFSSMRRKERGCKGWYSPSLSDKLRKKGSSFICGSQTQNHKRRQSNVHKTKMLSKSVQVLPLLSSSYDGGSSSTDGASDDTLTKYGELEMEALNRLDGRGLSNCRSQEGTEVVSPAPSNGDMYKTRSLDWKYRPRFFKEIIGQNIVVRSLNNAILKGRIAPAYLFQGPHGTGKTSCARIFAAALNCSSIEEQKPCGLCRECAEFASGLGSRLKELDATVEKSVNKVRYLLKSLPNASTSRHYNVIVVDQCHMISSKMWSAFIKFLEEPPSHVVFVLVTVDPDNLPHAIVSRCQKYLFSKIRDVDIVSRLRKLTAEERLDVEFEALHLIAVNSDGSMRDAESMLYQLSLLGRRITATLVNDLVGVVSDEKLLDLLEIAMSSDTAETVRRSRELLDSAIDPMALMAQLATLVMDIIAGTNHLSSSNSSDSILRGKSLNEAELNRLHQALKILSDSEKQLKHSSECSTWFTAALLQLGSGSSAESLFSSGGSSTKKNIKTCTSNVVEEPSVNDKPKASLKLQRASSPLSKKLLSGQSSPCVKPSSTVSTSEDSDFGHLILLPSSYKDNANHKKLLGCISPDKFDGIWRRCIEGCHLETLRHLLSTDGKLVSISDAGGELIVCIGFGNASNKSRAERFLSSITNSLEAVLKCNVKVRVDLVTDKLLNGIGATLDPLSQNQPEEKGMLTKERKVESSNLNCSSNQVLHNVSHNQPRRSWDYCKDKLLRTADTCEGSHDPDESSEDATLSNFSSKAKGFHGSKEAEHEITRQVLENAWLEAVERGKLGSVNCLKPERNQILSQNGIRHQNNGERENMAFAISSKHWEDELNYDIISLKAEGYQKDKNAGRVNNQALSPSTLHTNKWPVNFDEDNVGDDSGPGCNGLLCWKTKRLHQEKGKEGTLVRSRKTSGISWFSSGRLKAMKSRFGT